MKTPSGVLLGKYDACRICNDTRATCIQKKSSKVTCVTCKVANARLVALRETSDRIDYRKNVMPLCKEACDGICLMFLGENCRYTTAEDRLRLCAERILKEWELMPLEGFDKPKRYDSGQGSFASCTEEDANDANDANTEDPRLDERDDIDEAEIGREESRRQGRRC